MQFSLFHPKGVFTLVTCGHFLTSASKFNIEPNGGIFDVRPENDHASRNVKTSSEADSYTEENGEF